MNPAKRAVIEFSIYWRSEYGSHQDRFYVNTIDFLRDNFPGALEHKIKSLNPGETCEVEFPAGKLVPPSDEKKIITFPSRHFKSPNPGQIRETFIGRFYPQGFAWQGLNCNKGDYHPFRLINKTADTLTADTNHPLAKFSVKLTATLIEFLPSAEERGDVCNDIAQMVTEKGPGMQIPYPDIVTDFYSQYPFKRLDERKDELFYSLPRIVNHIDSTAIEQIKNVYSQRLRPDMKVLDLMSSWTSHLPDKLQNIDVVGLGMNLEELDANHQLSKRVIHDLNADSSIPFDDQMFDAVICTASIEYLVQPLEVMQEIARILKPGGIFITTFSDRWFPPKAITLWTEMHPFERFGLVLDFFIKTKLFTDLGTESIRGLPRPEHDKYSDRAANSDPVFAVWGRRR